MIINNKIYNFYVDFYFGILYNLFRDIFLLGVTSTALYV
nr:MAG TPA: hypothetical protein [Caudoviricetes sp.]